MALNNDATNLRESELKTDFKHIVHPFTLHARTNGGIKKPPIAPTTNSIESTATTTNADTQVRYKKRTSYSEL